MTLHNKVAGGRASIMFSFLDHPSGQGGAHEIFSFFEDFGFLGFRRYFMIIVDALNNCLERVDEVDRILRIILCIN